MRLGIITLYAGSDRLVKMTEEMLEGLLDSLHIPDLKVQIVAVNNGAARRIKTKDVNHVSYGGNMGCARGYNGGYQKLSPCDYVLTINNDIRMPYRDWLARLLGEASGKWVACPGTNRTATKESLAKGPVEKKATSIYSVSAYCWLIPWAWTQMLLKTYRFPLFDPAFTVAYGEDNWTALLFQRHYGPEPFRIIHRSWVDHIRAQTAKELTAEVDRKRSSALLRKKVNWLLNQRGLRRDVINRCRWYLKVLK